MRWAASIPSSCLFRPRLFLFATISAAKSLAPPLFCCYHCHYYALRRHYNFPSPHISHRPPLKHPSGVPFHFGRTSMSTPLSAATGSSMTPPPDPRPPTTTRAKRKARFESPENVFRYKLDMCGKSGDLQEALRLYDAARADGTSVNAHHFNVLLYLCSTSSDPSLGLERGFEIYQQMALDGVAPNEATFTNVARLAAAKDDPDLAFDLVKHMSAAGIPPKLRSFGPALFGFCKKGEVEKAHEVEAYMACSGVQPEEAELAALLQLNVDAGRGDDVYRLLHRMRTTVRQVLESTAEVVEQWFGSDSAAVVGVEQWDVKKVKEGVIKGGGGWHGQGWLKKGPWSVGRSQMDKAGLCRRCGERLVSIDIDPKETEDFAKSLTALACQREVRADFLGFQDWLDLHGPFDAVVDGANVGLNNKRALSFFQIKSVANGMCKMSPSKRLPLIILHRGRLKGGLADNKKNKRFLESWQRSGALYGTPPGSNDDWYWLYAAVRCQCLLVTNDEMRDHLFQLLGTSFFPRWKEKHQVRLTFSKLGPTFHMPPPYSIVIQESEGGSWHIPTLIGDDIEAPRQWVCATRDLTAVSSITRTAKAKSSCMTP